MEVIEELQKIKWDIKDSPCFEELVRDTVKICNLKFEEQFKNKLLKGEG